MAFKEWRVNKEESGLKLLRFLQSKLGDGYSLKALKRAVEGNKCTINGRVEHFGSMVVGNGDRVVFALDQDMAKVNAKAKSFDILFEDDDFLLINKPSGLASDDKSLLHVLQERKERSHLALAHRLDKETSGVLAFTKSERAKEALYQLFKERRVEKAYVALVNGIPKANHGHIENYLGKVASYTGQGMIAVVAKDKGALAVTDWKLVKRGKGVAELLVHPKTGRTHQIRVHLASIGHPILGDKQYGTCLYTSTQPKRCMLHALKLSFVNPFNKLLLTAEAPLPSEFKGFLS